MSESSEFYESILEKVEGGLPEIILEILQHPRERTKDQTESNSETLDDYSSYVEYEKRLELWERNAETPRKRTS